MIAVAQGPQSKVFRAMCNRSGQVVALKCYPKEDMHPITHRQIQREMELHSRLLHLNIIDFYGSFEDNRHYYIVQEIADGVRGYCMLCCIVARAVGFLKLISSAHFLPIYELYTLFIRISRQGDLFDEIRRRKNNLISEEEAVSSVVLPLLNAIAYVHRQVRAPAHRCVRIALTFHPMAIIICALTHRCCHPARSREVLTERNI